MVMILPDLIFLLKFQLDYGVYGEVNFGNIGQGILGKFEKMMISFDGNCLRLENLLL